MNKKVVILGSALTIVAAIGLTFSVTFAWYANSSQLNVDSIKISMETERELKLSTSSELDSFKSDLVTEDLDAVDLFAPASTMYKSKWMDSKERKPRFYDCSSSLFGIEGKQILKEVKTGFYSQSIYLLANDDVYVTLDTTDCYVNQNDEKNADSARKFVEKDPSLNYEEEKAKLDNLKKSVRISILDPEEESYNYFVFDPYKEKETLLGGILDNDSDRFYDSYRNRNDNKLYEVLYGEVSKNELAIYEEEKDEPTMTTGSYNSFNANIAAGVKHFNLEKSLENGLEIKEENAISFASQEEMDNNFFISLKRDTPKEIVLSIYLEGWDLDCINDTMGAGFISHISFKILRES